MEKYNISNTSQSSINLKPYESELFESDNFGNTRLHVAAALGDLNTVRNLVTKNSSLMENKNKYGSTPLHYATWQGQLKVVEYLVEQGSDLNIKDIYDQTLLHAAAWNGHFKLVKYFLTQGLDLESRDIQGNSPLLSAVKNGHFQIVEFLISKGANVEAKNVDGNTPLDIAIEIGNNDLVHYLKQVTTVKSINNEDNFRLHRIHQDDPQKLGHYLLKQNGELLNPDQEKRQRHKTRDTSSRKQASVLKSDLFDMSELNESLAPMMNATGFFRANPQAQAETHGFNLSSMSETGLANNRGVNSSNANGTFLLASTLLNKKPRKKSNTNVIDNERREREDRIIDSINTFESNLTNKTY